MYTLEYMKIIIILSSCKAVITTKAHFGTLKTTSPHASNFNRILSQN